MTTKYPYSIDGAIELPIVTDNVTAVKAEVVNTLRQAIIAIEAELGLDPSREYSTVRARLDAMSALISSLQAEIDGIGGGSGNANLTTLPPVNVTKSAAQIGTIQLAALSDHKHDVSTASATTIGSVNSEGNSTSLSRADHTHAVSGFAIAGQQKGSILYFDGTSWVVLNPSTDGYVLTTHSAGADPTWTAVSSGGNANLTNSAPVNVTKAAAAVGVATTAARADHKHDVTTAAPSNIGNANTEGSASSLARSDHVHALAGTVGGDLSGTLPNPTVVNFHIPGATTNSILYYNGSAWTILNAGQDGYVLTTHSTTFAPQWTSLPSGIGLGVVAPIDVDKSAAVIGVSARAAHEDHKHSIATATAVNIGAANAEGTSINMARADHTHAVVDLKMTSQSQGSTLYFNGTNWVVLAPSVNGSVLTSHSVGANPTWTVLDSSSIVNVSAVAGSNVTIALNTLNTYVNTLPTLATNAPANVSKSVAVIGVSTKAAREDHKHDVNTATAIPIGTINSEGTATTLARSDHTHAVSGLSITGQVQGDTLYFNGTAWVRLAPGTDGFVLTTHSIGANPTWSAAPTGVTLTGLLPIDVDANVAAVGVGVTAARNDHKHSTVIGIGTSTGAINAIGTAASLSRSDHKHAVVDLAISGQAQGDIIYFNGTNWVRLAAGVAGYVLTTNSVGANPAWAPAAVLSSSAPVNVNALAAAVGVGTTAARSDHKHNIDTAIAVTVGATNAIGVSTSLARADHTHAVNNLAMTSQVQGSIIYFNGTAWVILPPGADGLVLTTHSTGANPTWAVSPSGVSLTSSAPINVDTAAAVIGVATTAARADHKHQVTTGVPVNISNVNAQGVSLSLARSDHTHAGVYSFNGRLGPVVPTAGDYNSTQITNSSNVTGGTVTDALNQMFLQYRNVTVLTTSITFGIGDGQGLFYINANNLTCTIPNFSNVALPVGTVITCMRSAGGNGFTIAGQSGTVLRWPNNDDSSLVSRPYQIYKLTHVTTNHWMIHIELNAFSSANLSDNSYAMGPTIYDSLNFLYSRPINGRWYLPTVAIGATDRWGYSTNGWIGENKNGALQFPLPMGVAQMKILKCTATIVGAPGRSVFPTSYLPYFQLRQQGTFGWNSGGLVAFATDPSTTIAQYESPHDIEIIVPGGVGIFAPQAALVLFDEGSYLVSGSTGPFGIHLLSLSITFG